ncbi:MAG: hypothetical protein FJY95_08595 [Candidatus Handelsmanbacteria bacterium]|nr:hypothetical protein [Candidatus Handelsmanbacteria bacterium]
MTTSHPADLPPELLDPESETPPRSLLDLIELKVFDLELAAWLVSRISHGASFIVGSGLGGVGKTTTMRALLAFAPAERPFVRALPGKVGEVQGAPSCVISDELSDHPPPTYLWGQNLRDFFALSQRGHMLVGNMHTDDLEETRAQICATNEVPEAQFRSVNLYAFVRVEGVAPGTGRIKDETSRRFINEIYLSDGRATHQMVYTCGAGLGAGAPREAAHEGRIRRFLEEALAGNRRGINEVRRHFLQRVQ